MASHLLFSILSQPYQFSFEDPDISIHRSRLVKTINQVFFHSETTTVNQPISKLLKLCLVIEISRRPLRQTVPPSYSHFTHQQLFWIFFLNLHFFRSMARSPQLLAFLSFTLLSLLFSHFFLLLPPWSF